MDNVFRIDSTSKGVKTILVNSIVVTDGYKSGKKAFCSSGKV